MPVYNEVETIEEIIRRVMAVDCGLPVELVVCDDGSTDGTREKLGEIECQWPRERLKIEKKGKNEGKGSAIRRALELSTGDVLVIQDADLEYDPREYPQLLEPIIDGRADVDYGSRFLGGGPHRVIYYWHYLGNKFLTTISNMLYNINMTDMETCYKVFTRETIEKISIRSNGFALEPEITAKICKMGCRIYEVPISYSGRSYAEGKKITWRDGFRTLWALLRFRFTD